MRWSMEEPVSDLFLRQCLPAEKGVDRADTLQGAREREGMDKSRLGLGLCPGATGCSTRSLHKSFANVSLCDRSVDISLTLR